jgi:hypothetical protein
MRCQVQTDCFAIERGGQLQPKNPFNWDKEHPVNREVDAAQDLAGNVNESGFYRILRIVQVQAPARSRGFAVVNYQDSFALIHDETQASRQPNSNPARLKVRRHSFSFSVSFQVWINHAVKDPPGYH